MAGSLCWQDEVLQECTQGFRNEPSGPSQPPVRTDGRRRLAQPVPLPRAAWGGVASGLFVGTVG